MSYAFNRLFSTAAVAALSASFVTYYFSHPVTEKIEKKEDKLLTKDIKKLSKVFKYGVPERGPQILNYESHSVGYDYARRIPIWVAEHLTIDSLKGDANRKFSRFKSDPNIPKIFSAQNSDYAQSSTFKPRLSRGHMAPAADCKTSQDAMTCSFFYTNVVPQDLDNNGGFWNRLEMFTRDLTKHFSDIYVLSGPLFLSKPDPNDEKKRIVQYHVLGDSEVAVPTHLYKVIVAESPAQGTALAAFIVPNEPISSKVTDLTSYQVDLETLEKKSGLQLLSALDRQRTHNLCSIYNCNLQSEREFKQHIMDRKINRANSIEELENVWNEMRKEKFDNDQTLRSTYDAKKQQLGAQ